MLSIILMKTDNNSNTSWWSAVNATRLSLVTKNAVCGSSLLKRKSKQGWQQPARVHRRHCWGSASAIGAGEDVRYHKVMLAWLVQPMTCSPAGQQ